MTIGTNVPHEPELDRAARVALWKLGTPLGIAWNKWGDDRQRALQIQNRGTPRSMIFQNLMMEEIFGRISAGEFVAMGFRLAPTPSDGPVRMPADVFSDHMTDEWVDGIAEASGWRYERVTIHVARPAALPDVAASDTRSSTVPAPPLTEEMLPPTPPLRRGGGRKDTYELTRAALESLEAEDVSHLELSAEKLLPAFQERFRKVNRAASNEISPPGERTLRKQLARYRSEKSGKNRQ